jgi:tol-pal system protein YbgF
MTRFVCSSFKVLALVAAISATAVARADDASSPLSFFNRMFKGEDAAPRPEAAQQVAQNTPSDLVVRIDRLEAQVRQLTGIIEQLQYRNQQLEAQLNRSQQGSAPPLSQIAPQQRPPLASGTPLPPPTVTARRSDAFDPTQNPNAPGAPQSLGTLSNGSPPPIEQGQSPEVGDTPIGAPGGRQIGAPLDLTTMGSSQQAANDPNTPQSSVLPPPPVRNPSSTGVVASVLPPSATPRDQYDLGYGYVLRKDYALAEDAFQTFLNKFPNDKLVGDANFWLGEARFQRQRYDAAAEAFLTVSTKYTSNAKAPDAMLRLGQSLAALGQKEMACATLAEVGKKFPRASATVRQGVEREQKRVRC